MAGIQGSLLSCREEDDSPGQVRTVTDMRYISQMREGDRITDIYLCKQKQTLRSKSGKNYFSMILQDRTGIMDAKIWDLSNGINHFEAMDYIHVEGEVTSYQGSLQLNVRRVRLAQESEYDPGDYLPRSRYNPDAMYQELQKYMDSLQNEKMKKLVKSFLVDDKEMAKAFCGHSAAKSVHHSFTGGLLEHTLAVTRLCNFYCKQYPILNRDLLLTAAMLHDIGKLKELSAFPENDYTDEGQLLGHIVIGAEMVAERIRQIPGFPRKTAMELRHCILAHHGELEFGSPKKPAIIEAAALNYADNTDAKLETLRELIENNHDEGEWMGYNRMFETNFKKTSPM